MSQLIICGVPSPKACSTQLKRTSHRKLHHGAGIYHISLQTSSGSYTPRKSCMYNKAKKTQSETDWSRFKKIRKHIKSKLREAHDDYISDILDLGSLDEQGTQPKPTIGKKFWSYIRAQKKDTVGIPLLKVGQRDITDSVKKAEVLSNQYEPVFTDENLTAMPVISTPD